MIKASLIVPVEAFSEACKLCEARHGIQESYRDIDDERRLIVYRMPLASVIVDFNSLLKQLGRGYASFDYEDAGFATVRLAKMEIAVNGKVVNEFSCIVPLDEVRERGRALAQRLTEEIPRQMIAIAIQAKVGSKVVARENIKAYRKDVTAKLYGGDRTRRMKLLEQQKEGKRKMKLINEVYIPKEAFFNAFKA